MSRASKTRLATLATVAFIAALLGGSARAATVVNGDFETGTLSGWHVQRVTQAGNWFAYSGTAAPIGSKRPTPAAPVQPPPQGHYAATTDEANPDTLILYQDLSLEAGRDYRLSLLAYYDSYKPIAVPAPDTLSVDEEVLGGQKNQQFRIDVMKPDTPLDSVAPSDILLTLFTTAPGDPQTMAPTRLTADLGAFAGQTVRLRIANAVHEEVFNAGVDAVSISTSPTAPSQGGSRGGARGVSTPFGVVGTRVNRRNGTTTLRVRVPGPGLIRAKGAVRSGARRARSRRRSRPRKPIEPMTVPVQAAKTVKIHLRPAPAARAILRRRRRLRLPVAISYLPFGGSAEALSLPVVFRLAVGSHRRR